MIADLETVLADYRTGLDAELALLGDLETLATRQHTLPYPGDPDALTSLTREREVLLSALGALETQVAPLRDRITADLPRARAFPGFAGIQYPSIGALISKEIGDPRSELPNFVSIAPQRFFALDAFGPLRAILGRPVASLIGRPFVTGLVSVRPRIGSGRHGHARHQ